MINTAKKMIYHAFSSIFPIREVDSSFLSIVARMLFRLFGYAVIDYGGVKLKVTPHELADRFFLQGLHLNPFLTSAVNQVLAEGGVFLDIGANHGVLSLLAARNKNVRVFAFEPSPRELRRLFLNLALNQSSNITVMAYGVGDIMIEQEFILTDDGNPAMNSLPQVRSEGKPVLCQFAPLLDLLSQAVIEQARVCKVDIEGQEMIFFKSIKPFMHLFRKCVFVVEIAPSLLAKLEFSPQDIYAFFEAAGFQGQYGISQRSGEWEETFYHPDYNQKIAFSATI
jgi:FkbM family methyltransferase